MTFLDLTDTITLSDDTGRTSGFSCINESCVVTITGPTGTNALEVDFTFFDWVEPGTNIVSDEFCVGVGCTFATTSTSGTAIITFQSDTEPGSLGICPDLSECGVENGLVQTFATIQWFHFSGGGVVTLLATDTVGFQSDAVEPLPASAVLLLAGVGVLVMMRRRIRR